MKDYEFVTPISLPIPVETGSLAEAAELGRQIRASEQKTVAHFLETAHLCELGFHKYRTRGLPVLLREAEMSKPRFMKYVAIAHDTRLRQIENLLPPSFSTIHLICQLTDEQFDEAIKAEIIRPDVRRDDIKALREPEGQRDPIFPTALSAIVAGGRCQLIVPDHLAHDDCARLRRVLQRLQKSFGVEIIAAPGKDVM